MEARDTAKRPAMHRTLSAQQRIIWTKMLYKEIESMKQKSSDTKDRVRNCKSHQVAVLERKSRQIGREEIFREVIGEIPPQTEEMQGC